MGADVRRRSITKSAGFPSAFVLTFARKTVRHREGPMTAEPAYACDSEFLKLLRRRGDVDLTILALELARDAYPGLDFRPVLDWLDCCASQLSSSIVRSQGEPESLQLLSECLAERHKIFGDDECFERADSSYLH